jgi:hypothetical protein
MYRINPFLYKDPRLNEIQKKLTDTYHEAHKAWINEMSNQFGKNLRNVLLTSQWNDQCSSVLVWESKFILRLWVRLIQLTIFINEKM